MPKIPPWVAYTTLGVGIATLIGAGVYALLPDASPELCRGWVDPNAPAMIRQLARPIERLTNLDGLGDFLAGVAWIESRGNPQAGSDVGNAARGLYGMRPESARVRDLGLSPSVLKEPRAATALAAWYIHRCIPFADEGQTLDWLAFRRCWGYPTDTDDVDHPGYKNQLARGLACAGVNPDFMFNRAIRRNYNWPGIEAVFAAVGRPLYA